MTYSRINAHLNAAKGYAKLSHAKRLQVGAVLVREDRIISLGYNGTPSGMNNNCETTLVGTQENHTSFIGEEVTKPEVCHAEMNCVAFAAKNGIATNGSTLVTTHSPCYDCAKLLIQSGVVEVFYEENYRDVDPINLLNRALIRVERI